MRKPGGPAVEILASAWLVIVAVQFIDRYFGTRSLDLTYTYWGMLAILVVVSAVRMVRRAVNRSSTSRIHEREHE